MAYRFTKSRVATLLVAALCALPAAAQKCGKVLDVTPPAFIETPSQAPGQSPVSREARVGSPVSWRNYLVTGERGRLSVVLDGGAVVTIASRTKLDINKHDARSQQSAFDLVYGSARVMTISLTQPDSSFEVRSQTAVTGALGATDFVVSADNPVETTVQVIAGRVAMRSANPNFIRSTTVNAGQSSHGEDVVPLTPEMRQQIEYQFPKPVARKGQYQKTKVPWASGPRSSITVMGAFFAYNI